MNCIGVLRTFHSPASLLSTVGTIRARPTASLIKILISQFRLAIAKLRYGVFLTCWYAGATVTTDDCDEEVAPMGTLRVTLGGFDGSALVFCVRLSSCSGFGPYLRARIPLCIMEKGRVARAASRPRSGTLNDLLAWHARTYVRSIPPRNNANASGPTPGRKSVFSPLVYLRVNESADLPALTQAFIDFKPKGLRLWERERDRERERELSRWGHKAETLL